VGEVTIRVTGCGVCGTDQHIYAGEVAFARPPVVIGHEIAGTVYEIGEGVDDLEIGQSVALDPVIPCDRCEYCAQGYFNLCEEYTVMGYHVTGGFAEYTLAPRRQVYPLSERTGVKGGVLAEPLACVINGFDRIDIQAGGKVLLLGAGPIGLLWTQMVSYTPSVEIVQVEGIEMRSMVAEKLGAHRVILSDVASAEEQLREEYPDGFEYVIDVTGDPQAVEVGIKLTKKAGTMMIFGVCPEGSEITVDPYEIYLKEMRIVGSKMPPRTLGRAVKVIESGKIDDQTIVSDLMPLEELEEALDLFAHGRDRVLKMAIVPPQG
jgi:threonine dehydrogenase-like Zn-dependent dehydrogenase